MTFHQKCAKKCAKLKITKTALSGDSQESSSQGICQSVMCVPECFASKSRPDQAQEPCPAFPSLLQLIPARSGPRSFAQLPKGSGRVPSIQGACQRINKVQVLLSAQGCVQVKPRPCAPSVFRNCAQDGKPHVSRL